MPCFVTLKVWSIDHRLQGFGWRGPSYSGVRVRIALAKDNAGPRHATREWSGIREMGITIDGQGARPHADQTLPYLAARQIADTLPLRVLGHMRGISLCLRFGLPQR